MASPRQGRAEGLFSGGVEPGSKLKDRDVVGAVELGRGGRGVIGSGGWAVGFGLGYGAAASVTANAALAPCCCLTLSLCGGGPEPSMHR